MADSNRPTIAGLQGQVAGLEKELAAERSRRETAEAAAASSADKASEVAGQAAQVAAQMLELQDENRDLRNQLKAYKGSATKARNEVLVLKAALSPDVRPIGAFRAPRDEGEAADRRERLAAALANGPTTLVFSDGKREIRELAPLIVDAGAWQITPQGFRLNHGPVLEPGEMNKPEVRIAGFGLLNEAGEQVGWQPLLEPIVVPRNMRVGVPVGSVQFA